MADSTAITRRVELLQREVDELKDLVKKLQFTSDVKHHLEEHQRASMLASMQREAEGKLADSPLFKMLHQQLLFAFTIGTALWIGGTIYAGIKLKSIQEDAAEFKARLEELNTKSEQAEAQLRRYLDSRTSNASRVIEQSLAQVRAGQSRTLSGMRGSADVVRRTADHLISELGATSPGSYKAEVVDASRAAVASIRSEKARAEQLLDVKKLPDLRLLRTQIRQLQIFGGKLNLRSVRAFVDYSVGVLLAILIGICLLCVMSCFLMWRSVRVRRSRV